jgi:hypothetical protein
MENLNIAKKIIFYGLICSVLVALIYQLFLIFNAPNFKETSPINISATVNTNLTSNYSNQTATQLTNEEFSYKVVGYRAGEKNSSVVLRKADVDYVVQQGDLIDNTYRLISVSKEEIVFDRAGKQMYIKMD